MPVRPGRVATISLAFDMLEERGLLSHWSMPAPPDWGFPGGNPGAPGPAFAFAPNRPPAPFASGPGVSSQSRPPAPSVQTPPDAPAITSAGSPDSGAPSAPLAQTSVPRVPPPSDQGSGGPAGEAGVAQEIATNSASSVQLAQSSTVARPIDSAIGTASVGASGVARLVPVTLGLIVPDAMFARSWVSQPGPLFRELEAARPPNAVSGSSDAAGDERARATLNLPNPRGAGLITEFAAFRRTPIGECLNRLLGGLTASDEPVTHQARNNPYVLTIALAVAALETVRRWRRSPTRTTGQTRRVRNSLLIGLPRASR
jgi:hypothetical protein